jgi:hypothetical protein
MKINLSEGKEKSKFRVFGLRDKLDTSKIKVTCEGILTGMLSIKDIENELIFKQIESCDIGGCSCK